MQTIEFGKTGLQITPIGLGAWAMGGNSWGPQDDRDSIATIQKALDLGLNWIDTAAIYGMGHAESVVGKAIRGREKPLLFTKCSIVWDEDNNRSTSLKAASLRKELEGSLKRLGVETIDLYQMHWPNPEDEIEEGWQTLQEFIKEGKIRHAGVSNFSVEQMELLSKISPVETLQPPYSIIQPEAGQEILPYCHTNNIGVIVYSPQYSGLLSGKMNKERLANFPSNDHRRKNPEFVEPRVDRHLALADLLGEIGQPHGVSAGIVAIAWTLHNPGVSAAIVGARHPAQIEELLPANDFRLSDAEFAQIEAFVSENP